MLDLTIWRRARSTGWWSRDGIRCLLKNSHLIFVMPVLQRGVRKKGTLVTWGFSDAEVWTVSEGGKKGRSLILASTVGVVKWVG